MPYTYSSQALPCATRQVMKKERNRRGIKAEIEESREILEAYVEENKVLVALLARGKTLVQTLQISSTDSALHGSPLMQVLGCNAQGICRV